MSDEEKQKVIQENSMFNDDTKMDGNVDLHLNETEYREFLEYMLGEDFINEVKNQLNEEEYVKTINECYSNDYKNFNALNEEFPGVGAWQPNKNSFGWLTAMAIGGLSALIVFIAKLGSHIKQQVLIAALRRYMAKLVELTDNGAYKKKGLFSWFHRTRLDDDNKSCLKTLQKINERRFCMYTAMAAKSDGFSFNGNEYGGLEEFKNNVANKMIK